MDELAASLTDEERQSLKAVCAGEIHRKDSLVNDAKFDKLLASLQSLASDLEKDFREEDQDENRNSA